MSDEPISKTGSPGSRLVGAATIAAMGAATLLVLYAVHSVIPYNPVQLPREKQVNVRLWTPQGWKFFTRNPREDWLLTFRQDNGHRWEPTSLGPNARAANLFGFDRAPRAQMIETAWIVNAIPGNAWRPCKTAPEACLPDARVPMQVSNPTPHPTLCGEVGLAFLQQKPWAWGGSSVQMPSRVARVEVLCSRG